MKVLLSEATEAQLRTFAEAYLGMTFPGNTKVETMRAKIAAAWNKDEILVEEAPAVEPQVGAAPRPVTPDQQPPARNKVKLIIQRTDDAGGDDPVPLSVNGRAMLVPRGQEVEIPAAYFEVLEHAVMDRFESLPDGGLNPVPRKVPLYPFQRIA